MTELVKPLREVPLEIERSDRQRPPTSHPVFCRMIPLVAPQPVSPHVAKQSGGGTRKGAESRQGLTGTKGDLAQITCSHF